LRRLWCAALGASLTVSACKIQRTPQEYIDHRSPVQQVRESATEELTALLAAMDLALARGDLDAALDALAFSGDAYLIRDDGAAVVEGGPAVRSAMREWTGAQGEVRAGDSRVTVGPRGSSAWFLLRLERGSGREPAQLSGVVVRGDESRWELVQAHLSETAAHPAAFADTVATPIP
jgi:hypothetical protein